MSIPTQRTIRAIQRRRSAAVSVTERVPYDS
jgi:c-di-GMP-binding flagellar brake protein YcgR